MAKIRTILAEPHPIFMDGAVGRLDATEDIEVVATVRTGHEALDSIHEHIPNVAVIAIQLPDISGLEVLEALRRERMPIIVLTADESKETVFEAMMLGARGYLMKWYEDIPLPEAIRRVNAGEIVMGAPSVKLFVQAVRERVVLSPGGRNIGKQTMLSAREAEILTLIGKGHTQNRIASMLGIAPTTIRTHCRNAYIKLGVKNQAAAISEAIKRGFIESDGDLRRGEPRTSRSDQRAPALHS